MKDFRNYIPTKAIETIEYWLNKHQCQLSIKPPRKTKLGDYKFDKGKHCISINDNLNPYSFLITLTHEIAHMVVKDTYPHPVLPHGKEWKLTFRNLMLPLLEVFPSEIQKPLARHLKNPKASSSADYTLLASLKLFDKKKKVTISDIPNGTVFFTHNGKQFLKEKKLRRRFQCKCLTNNRTYVFNPFAEITL